MALGEHCGVLGAFVDNSRVVVLQVSEMISMPSRLLPLKTISFSVSFAFSLCRKPAMLEDMVNLWDNLSYYAVVLSTGWANNLIAFK